MSFNLEEFRHEHLRIEMPDTSELYEMLRARADPTALVDVELPELPDNFFRSAVSYLETRLKQLAELEHKTIDVYVGWDLLAEAKAALEKMRTRALRQSAVYFVWSKGQ